MSSINKLIPCALWALLILLGGSSRVVGESASVTLPLEDYLRLVENIERLEEERQSPAEPAVAELTSQATMVKVDDAKISDAVAVIEASYQVELRGPIQPVALPMSGVVTSAKVESSSGEGPTRSVALHRKSGELLLVASEPGSYRVSVSARMRLEDVNGISRLRLALSRAGVATLRVDLPSELRWNSVHAVAVEESTAEGRRRLRLAPTRGKRPVLELRRDATGAVEEQTRARAVMLTVARLGTEGVQRHDVVLYEVSRGELSRFEIDLPPGESAALEVERTVTDEGPAQTLIEERRLSVERQHHLGSAGYLTLSYPPSQSDAAGRVSLAAIEPTVPVRSHYLVLASDRAGTIEPRPVAAWSRVDLDDLPRARRAEIAAIGPSSVWRRTETPAEPWLQVETYSAVDALPAIVGRRLTTTLLTVDGSLVHRDVFDLRRAGAAFRLTLPTDATLWSVTVDGQAVRPIERVSEIAVPLAFKTGGAISDAGTRVEIVTVLDQSVPRGASRLVLQLARLSDPVLEHQWRLLLPKQHRYRFAKGDLRPAPPHEAATIDVGTLSTSLPRFSVVDSIEGDSGIIGTVAEPDGAWLPGAMITAIAADGRTRSVVADGSGEFAFFGLGPGTYRVTASLDGFSSLSREVKVPARRTVRCELTMPLAAVEETIMVTASSPLVGPTSSSRAEYGDRKRQQAAQKELEGLQQGLVGGVKPLAVDIPESGKLLLLAGVLPPPEVGVELEVRARQ